MSDSFRAVEGFIAIDFEYPVFSGEKGFIGSVSMLFRPESFIRSIIQDAIKGSPFDVWVMERNGRILYDPDEAELGRDLFTDPIYRPFPQLISLGKRIAQERSGSGSYRFFDNC